MADNAWEQRETDALDYLKRLDWEEMIMNTPSPVPSLWGPSGCAAAVSITFDNLGEAVELERGIWPEAMPLGQHPSVVKVLPAILKMLDNLALSATLLWLRITLEKPIQMTFLHQSLLLY